MAKVMTITLNPALDISTSVDCVMPDIKLRCRTPRIDAGGGGVNVSRAMAKLGVESVAFVALGGATGQALLARLGEEAISIICYDTTGETRQSFAVLEDATGEQYRFVLPGPQWSPDEFEACRTTLAENVVAGDRIVISGSLPPGLPSDAISRLVDLAADRGASLLIDTSGPALDRLADSRSGSQLTLIISEREAKRLTKRDHLEVSQANAFAGDLVARGAARSIVITLGVAGAVGIVGEQAWHVAPPMVPVVSKVGAGDSFAAGLVIGLDAGWSFEEALTFAMAAAASAVTTPATELCTEETTRSYRSMVQCRRL